MDAPKSYSFKNKTRLSKEPQLPRRDQDAGHGSLGVEEPREAAAAGKAAATAAFGAGGEVAAERAHAAAWGGEKGPVGAPVACRLDQEHVGEEDQQEDAVEEEQGLAEEEQEEEARSSGGPQGPRRQLFAQELAEEGAAAGPQPQDQRSGSARHSTKNRVQLRKMKSVFLYTEYPHVLVRKNLAMNLNVSEAKVQEEK
ncbi:homeobox protein ARX-like [Ochotona princeps]|uniref:homeobox protein ARX-like n=1 Tax=Ochotona princeps TaxID=9978 RepID=UPI002715155C|nr:homeobox protein ARX-like [Ochotona princeps]